MTTIYKLTDQDGYTRRGESYETLWAENTTHEATGTGGLCTSGIIHAYEHPLIASFINPIHASLKNPILWECSGESVEREGQLKCGCKKITTVRRIDLPEITLAQRVRICIYCALQVYSDPKFVAWAQAWLDGSDRSAMAMAAMAAEAWAAAMAMEAAEAWAMAAMAAMAMAMAAAAMEAEAWAAAMAMEAAEAAAMAAEAWAMAQAAEAAEAAAMAADFDLLEIIKSVVEGGK